MGLGLEEVFVFDSKRENKDRAVETVRVRVRIRIGIQIRIRTQIRIKITLFPNRRGVEHPPTRGLA